MNSIPIHDAALTCATSINMFYHVRDQRGAIAEVARVLATGGRFAFDDWVLASSAGADDVRDLQHHWGLHTSWIVDDELFAALNAAGLRITATRDYATVGRGPMKRRFREAFESKVRPILRALDETHGDAIADAFRAAVDHTIALYEAHKLRYLQLVAVREER
jgi:SAM-dependent methyltransferase